MFELSQSFYFEAAHTLHRQVDVEPSRRVHGHTYTAEVTVHTERLGPDGMVMDLGLLRRAIARVREQLDHRFLDEVEGIGPATLENLCVYIHKQLLPDVPGLSTVSVSRASSGDRCTYRP